MALVGAICDRPRAGVVTGPYEGITYCHGLRSKPRNDRKI